MMTTNDKRRRLMAPNRGMVYLVRYNNIAATFYKKKKKN